MTGKWMAVVVAVLAASVGPQAGAVVILDSTWAADGGRAGQEARGFGSALALAAQPQFAAVLALSGDGRNWGEASATWIGNDDAGHGFLLTSAHIFTVPATPDQYVVRTPDGRTAKVDRVWVHPRWNGDTDSRTGHDLAILRLDQAVMGAGAPPVLYAGSQEAGKVLTFVGYGSRGIGSTGEQDKFYQGSDKAAAQGRVDQVEPPHWPVAADADAGNYLGIYLPREDGRTPNPYGGPTHPVSRLAGLLGSGDSGGSAWIEFGGQWRVVAVNSNGDGTARYGDSSWFTRIAANRPWIEKIVPGVRFAGD